MPRVYPILACHTFPVSVDVDPQALHLENLFLAPLSALYYAGWMSYEAIYALGIKRPFEPQIPVIVIGNLTVGGMGKTPTTLHIAQSLREMGHKVVVSASGYGAPRAAAAQVAPEGQLEANEWGDEPALFRWLMPDMPLIVGRRRVLAAQLAAEHFPGHMLLMDDGFQHKPLKKHISILLDPPQVRNPLVLPGGPYREPRSHRKWADILIPDDFQLKSEGVYFMDPNANRIELPPQEIQVLTAIAKPYRFVESLNQMGYRMVKGKHLSDHDPLTAGNLFATFKPELPIMVTAKDWVKLRGRDIINGWKIWIGHYDVSIEPQHEFRAVLQKKLDEIETP